MKRKLILTLILVGGLLLTFTIVRAARQPAVTWGRPVSLVQSGAAVSPQPNGLLNSDPITTTITYQGRLIDGGGPANGLYDFEFLTFDDLSAGSQVGITVTVEDASVVDGLFMAELNFGEVLYSQQLWLEIGVRSGSDTGAYTILSPRQQLTAIPYALSLRPGAVISGPSPFNGVLNLANAFGDGLKILNTYEDGVEIDYARDNGVQVDSAYGNGLQVVNAVDSGVLVNQAGDYGVYAKTTSATYYGGYFLNTATGGVGLYAEGGSSLTPDLILGGSIRGYLSSDPSGASSNLRFVSNDDFLVWLDDDDNEAGFFGIYNGANSLVFTVDENGNYSAAGSKSAVVDTADYGQVKLYAMESPENWFEDFGSAALSNGEAIVTIEPVFAATVNLGQDYHVFLTPLGDCALYVAEETTTSFTVRALGGATCSIDFDYRIVAKRLGYEALRLEPADFDQIGNENCSPNC